MSFYSNQSKYIHLIADARNGNMPLKNFGKKFLELWHADSREHRENGNPGIINNEKFLDFVDIINRVMTTMECYVPKNDQPLFGPKIDLDETQVRDELKKLLDEIYALDLR